MAVGPFAAPGTSEQHANCGPGAANPALLAHRYLRVTGSLRWIVAIFAAGAVLEVVSVEREEHEPRPTP